MIKLTGKFTLNSLIITGYSSKFLLELNPYDTINIGAVSNIRVKAVVNDTTAIAFNGSDVSSQSDTYLVTPNSGIVEINNLEPSDIEIYKFDRRLNPNLMSAGIQYLISDQVFKIVKYGTQGGGSNSYYLVDKFKLDDLVPEAIMKVPGHLTVIQHDMPQFYMSSDGTTKLSLLPTSYNTYKTIENNQLVPVIANSYISGIAPGQTLLLGNTEVKVTELVTQSACKIDTTVDFNGRVQYADNPGENFSYGDKVLINGKLNTVISASSKALTVDYKLPVAGNYLIRKPIMSNPIGINTLELSTDIPLWIKPGDYIIIQYLEGQDTVSDLPIYYQTIRQIKTIINANTIIATVDNTFKCRGMVNFAVSNNGLTKLGLYNAAQNYITGGDFQINLTKFIRINDLIVIGDEVKKVTSVNSTDLTFSSNLSKSYTQIPVYVFLSRNNVTLTSELNSLGLRKVAEQIKMGKKLFTSYNSLSSKFKREFKFSVYKFASAPKLYTYSEPQLLALEQYAAPPIPFNSLSTCVYLLSNSNYSNLVSYLSRCGLPIVQKG